ncbi:carbohydrate ABC transporter permease [Mesorhizobium sp. B2-4-17]|uniref:carbohydrate ABC transporter permease n=1 Tax=Mesorhizobium sp. B2-4-17 TaxID=2589932 RepID=UPI001FEEC417|nr:carbohydrate ABC transporter permease [Mesorhizobium sp. B2-4-17]
MSIIVEEGRFRAAGSVLDGAPKVKDRRFTLDRAAVNASLLFCGLLFVLPLTWLIVASVDATASRQVHLPTLTMDNFYSVAEPGRMRGILNSVIISMIATIIATVPSIFAGYAFSRRYIPFKSATLLIVLFLSGVPINIVIVPVYQIFASLNWLSMIPTAVFLGVTSLPFVLFIVKNAIDAIPLDLEESARIEGANTAQILWRVVVPLAMPGIAAGAIFAFVNTWGNFLAPLVLITSSDMQPSPVKIFSFLAANVTRYGGVAAYSIVYSAPVVILYLVLNRVFRKGFVLGGAVRG